MTLRALALSALAASATLAVAAQAETLTVYTALEADQLKAYEQAFEKAHPGIEIKWVRDSTGIVTAKLLAEKDNPQADVIMGLAATSLVLFKQQDMLMPYAPANLDKISPQYRDADAVPSWVGMDVWGATVCFNTVEAGKQNLPKPESWMDLTKPVYAGKVVMPNPASSGTGFLDVTSWLQLFGEEKGWAYMDDLHKNIAQYTHSGSKPCKMAAAGEFPIGVSFEYRAAKLKSEGAPIDLVFPKEGLGWDLEATAIMKTTKKVDAAKKLADWSASPEAMALYAQNFAVVAMPGVAKPIENIPADYEQRLVKNDFGWAAANREAILAEWNKRFDAKSEPKK